MADPENTTTLPRPIVRDVADLCRRRSELNRDSWFLGNSAAAAEWEEVNEEILGTSCVSLADAAALMNLVCSHLRMVMRPNCFGDVWLYRVAEDLRESLEDMKLDEERGLLVRLATKSQAAQ